MKQYLTRKNIFTAVMVVVVVVLAARGNLTAEQALDRVDALIHQLEIPDAGSDSLPE